jgi:predicted aspartyl protease
VSKIQHFAFKSEYSNLSLRLITEAEIFEVSLPQKKIRVNALWDTGAMLSAITPEAAQRLNLTPFNKIKVNGINNTSIADLVKISVKLPNLVEVKNFNATVCNLVKNVDLIIGMDIIRLGDFSISNGKGKTLFTFAMPPFEDKIDLYEKAVTGAHNNFCVKRKKS